MLGVVSTVLKDVAIEERPTGTGGEVEGSVDGASEVVEGIVVGIFTFSAGAGSDEDAASVDEVGINMASGTELVAHVTGGIGRDDIKLYTTSGSELGIGADEAG